MQANPFLLTAIAKRRPAAGDGHSVAYQLLTNRALQSRRDFTSAAGCHDWLVTAADTQPNVSIPLSASTILLSLPVPSPSPCPPCMHAPFLHDDKPALGCHHRTLGVAVGWLQVRGRHSRRHVHNPLLKSRILTSATLSAKTSRTLDYGSDAGNYKR